jgi:hypothetical protein
MRRINKKCALSKKYRAWVRAFEKRGEDHPQYTSSSNPFYWDVVMNLFHCQAGLCAYTEMFLCNGRYYEPINWIKGAYSCPDAGKNPQVFGQLDHFDPGLKETRGWLWENFFMAHTDINTKMKRANKVDTILKPDESEYDETELLEYDDKAHQFIANTGLSKRKQDRINKMILILGINFDAVKDRRRRVLSKVVLALRHGVPYDEPDEFPTALQMLRKRYTPAAP